MQMKQMKKLVAVMVGLGAMGAQAALTAVTPCSAGGVRRMAEKMELVRAGGAPIVFVGDSITQNWESPWIGLTSWRKYFAEGRYRALNLGFSGDRTENTLWRIGQGLLDGYEARAVVLMIGTNNTGSRSFREEPPIDTIAGVEAVIRAIRAKQPKARVVLCPIFPRTDAKGETRRRNETVNKELLKVCDGKRVIWCDFTAGLTAGDGSIPQEVMFDGLHPSYYGYEVWAGAVIPYLDAILEAGDDFTRVFPPLCASSADAARWCERGVRPALPATRWYGEGAAWRGRPEQQRTWIVDDTNRTWDVVFVGDSITHRWENGANGKAVYDRVLKDYKVLNLGIGGDETQHVVWRLKNGQLEGYRAKLFMVMIGTNNSDPAPNTAKGVQAIVELIVAKHPESKVLLLPVFPRGKEPLKDERGQKLNELLRAFATSDAARGQVIWLDFNDRFLDGDGHIRPGLMMPDNLHPIQGGYELWYEAVRPVFREVVGK